GGTGRLYGAIVGVPLYMLLEDRLAKISPEFWSFGIGLLLIVVVLFFRGGLVASMQALVRRSHGGGHDAGVVEKIRGQREPER
ncbi:MAG TPA: hypothetical protein VK047_10645, partial [Zeimonas sp.]|nr:hypothetical protein [Zeimonas sp.]